MEHKKEKPKKFSKTQPGQAYTAKELAERYQTGNMPNVSAQAYYQDQETLSFDTPTKDLSLMDINEVHSELREAQSRIEDSVKDAYSRKVSKEKAKAEAEAEAKKSENDED